MSYILLDRKYITQQEFDSLYKQSNTVANLNNGFIRYLVNKGKSKDKTGV